MQIFFCTFTSFFQVKFSGIPSECQAVGIRRNIFSGLIWIHRLQRLSTKKKSPYLKSEMIKVAASRETIERNHGHAHSDKMTDCFLQSRLCKIVASRPFLVKSAFL